MNRPELMDALEGHILKSCADRTRQDANHPPLAWSDVVTVLARLTDLASQIADAERKST